MMRHLLTYCLSGLLILFSIQCPNAAAQELELTDMEVQLFGLINEARVQPLAVAESVGLDPQKVLAGLPELHDTLVNGLPPLYFNLKLRQAARKHTEEMLRYDYINSIAPNGVTPEDRIIDAGYAPRVSGESLGVLGFFNFISPDDAVQRIFENLIKDEFSPERTEHRYILSPEIEEVGIGFGSGRLTLGGNRFNTYVATCDFGATAVSAMEMELLQMINQVRSNPLKVAAALGMDVDRIWAELPEIRDILTNGLPPLRFDPRLYLSATAHARDMLENDYYSEVSEDGRTVQDRVLAMGYDPVQSGQTMRMLVTTDYLPPEEGASIHLKRLLERELVPDAKERFILNPDMKDAGVSLIFNAPEMWAAEEASVSYSDYYSLFLVIDFGAEWTPDAPVSIEGVAYRDADGNGLLDFGEGLTDIPVTVTQGDFGLWLATDEIGYFSTPVETGAYQVTADFGSAQTRQWININEYNHWVELRVDML